MARRAGQSGAELGRNSSALHLALFDGSQSAERGSELVVKDRIDLSTFRFQLGSRDRILKAREPPAKRRRRLRRTTGCSPALLRTARRAGQVTGRPRHAEDAG